MQRTYMTLAAAGLTALLSTTALAAVTNLKEMKDGSSVSLTGIVDAVKDERNFTLRDSTGSIAVEITSNESVVLKTGDRVSVNGTLDKGVIQNEINASSVIVNKTVTQAMGDAIEGHTGISLEGAAPYDIANLPKEGLVKVSGTVSDVDNEKEFTVRDDTGSINVDVKSSEAAAVTKGAEVTVIGYMDSGILGKNIDAHKVLVVANANTANHY